MQMGVVDLREGRRPAAMERELWHTAAATPGVCAAAGAHAHTRAHTPPAARTATLASGISAHARATVLVAGVPAVMRSCVGSMAGMAGMAAHQLWYIAAVLPVVC